MANRKSTFLLKRSNIIGKIPSLTGLTIGEIALNTAEAKLYTIYTSGTTNGIDVREIGWDKFSITGGTIYGSVSATTLSSNTIHTNYIFDTNNSSGSTNQILISTPNGIEWLDLGTCYPSSTTTSGLEYKQLDSITGLTSGSYIVKSYVTSYSGESKYGFWERTLGVTSTGGTPTIKIETQNLDDYYSGFVPSQVVYQSSSGNSVNIFVSGVTGENLYWESFYEIIGQNCDPTLTTIVSGGTFTGNTSATCISDLFVSNLDSCSPLYIQSKKSDNVYFGPSSAITMDFTNNEVSLGTEVLSVKLVVNGGVSGSFSGDGSNIINIDTDNITGLADEFSNKTDLSSFTSHTGAINPHGTRFQDLNVTAHTHSISDISNLPSQLDLKANLSSFNTHTGNTNNPHQTTFYNLSSTAHTHTISDISNLSTQLSNKFETSGGTINGSVSITGNFTVIGTATTINTQTLAIEDNLVILNSNYTGGTPFLGNSGIEVLRGSATTVNLVWDESNDYWTAGFSGSTKRIILEGDNLSLLNSGHTHSISEITNLQTSLDNKFDKSGGTISGNTTFTNGLSGNTISGGTYYGDGSNLSGIYKGFTGGTVSGDTIYSSGLTASTLNVTNQINSNSLSGTTDRMVQVNSGGTISADRVIISAYISDGGIQSLLDNTSNWNPSGVYTGTTITGTYQGQKHYNSNYFFEAVDNNLWIRLSRV